MLQIYKTKNPFIIEPQTSRMRFKRSSKCVIAIDTNKALVQNL